MIFYRTLNIPHEHLCLGDIVMDMALWQQYRVIDFDDNSDNVMVAELSADEFVHKDELTYCFN